MNHVYVVVDDPRGDFPNGALIGTTEKGVITRHGGRALPCRPDLLKKNGASGFFRRDWGTGWILPSTIPEIICPTVLYAATDSERVHWAARLAPLGTQPVRGGVHLKGDSSQRGPMLAPIHREDLPCPPFQELGHPDDRGGWTIGGEVSMRVSQEGFFGLGLYAFGHGRILWLALSQT